MKPTAVLDMHRTGDLGGNKVTMKIDENSLAHVMSLLTDLYSDPELAVIREYSTNARDSHIMAGNVGRAIEVTLPNQMSPYFKVKDFGLGMDVDDIEETYSKYGASTKRGTNDANGMLGLGCKSALTYTSQFTITAVKDGKKSIVMVSRVEDGTGVMEIVATSDTTEPNGVEISVPVKQGNRFQQKAMNFFRFWEKGTVLVNGAAVEEIARKQVLPGLFITKSVLDEDTIVMGGVSYPVPGGLYEPYRGYNSFKVLAFVEIGEVNFTPSRESLSMTPLTKATIARLKTDFARGLHQSIRDSINAERTAPAAFDNYLSWGNSLGFSAMPKDVTWTGQKIEFDFSGDFTYWNGRSGRWSVQTQTTVDYRTVKESIIVLGYDRTTDKNLKGLTPTQKKKIHAVANIKSPSSSKRSAILGLTEPGLPWIDNAVVIQWADVLAHKLPKATPSGQPKPEPVFNLVTDTGFQSDVPLSKIDQTKPVYYISPRDRVHNATLKSLTTELGNATIVVMGENRWEKFLRDVPTAKRLTPAVEALRDKVIGNLTAHDKQNLTMDYYDKQFLSSVDATLIDDPVIQSHVAVAKGLLTTPTIKEYERVCKIVKSFGLRIPAINNGYATADILADYPLINGGHVGNTKHAILYMNAVYAAKKNGAI